MKNILIILLFLGLSNVIYSQSQYQLPIESGVWKVENVYCRMNESELGNEGWGKSYLRNFTSFYSHGDSVINDTTYFIIESSTEGLMGALRQDSALVFYKPFQNSKFKSEILLYDFNVTDRFSIKTPYETIETFNVVTIDSIEIDGINRKRIEFDDYSGHYIGKYWIEGIGSTGGILKPYYPTPIPTCLDCCGVEENLVCLKNEDGGIFYIKDNYFDCDSLVSAIERKPRSKIIFALNDKVLTITNNENQQSIEKIELFDNMGRLIFVEKIVNQKNNQIKLTGKGMNIIRVTTDSGCVIKKYIINNR